MSEEGTANCCCGSFVDELQFIDSKIEGNLEIAMWKCKACEKETWIYSKILKVEIYSSEGKLLKEKFFAKEEEKLTDLDNYNVDVSIDSRKYWYRYR